MPPLISVVMPVYNGELFLKQAIESVLDQTYKPCELVIMDDGSTDGTRAIAEGYGTRVRVIAQDHRGLVATLNHGIEVAQGEFVVFADSDDVMLPDKLSHQAAMLIDDSTVDFINSGWQVIDASGQILREVRHWEVTPNLDLPTWLLWKPVLPGAMIFRRQRLLDVGGFDPRCIRASDVDIVLRLSAMGCKAVWLRELTLQYRQHEGNASRNIHEQADSLLAVLERFFARGDLDPAVRGLENRTYYTTLIWLARRFAETGEVSAATPYLRQSLRHSIFSPDSYTVIDWLAQLEKQSADCDFRAVWWPVFREAAAFDPVTWEQTERMLDWWINIQSPYAHGNRETGCEALAAYRGQPARALVKLAYPCIYVSPTPITAGIVDSLWQDAVDQNVVAPSEAYEAVTLYLTVFSKAILRRDWSAAAIATRRALQTSTGPGAMYLWLKFVEASFRFVGHVLANN